jgi:hypothetical protein
MDARGIWGGKMQLILHAEGKGKDLYFSFLGLQVLLELYVRRKEELYQPNGTKMSRSLLQGPSLPL